MYKRHNKYKKRADIYLGRVCKHDTEYKMNGRHTENKQNSYYKQISESQKTDIGKEEGYGHIT